MPSVGPMFSGILNANDSRCVKIVRVGEQDCCGKITYHGLGRLRKKKDSRCVDTTLPSATIPSTEKNVELPIVDTKVSSGGVSIKNRVAEDAEYKLSITDTQKDPTLKEHAS